jgi:superfamily II DNA or RNA helicase
MIVMTVESLEPPPAIELTEAFGTLIARVGRKSAKIPASLLVRHILTCVPASEWPVRLEAMDALLRRLDSVKSDVLRIASRPSNGRILGLYTTRRRTSKARPYQTTVAGIDPIEARCDCPDFVKNALGVCKHVLSVLEDIYDRPRALKKALAEQAEIHDQPRTGLVWDPIRPLTGEGDWLERVSWSGSSGTAKGTGEKPAILRLFRQTGGNWTLRSSHLDRPERRLELVSELLDAFPAGITSPRHDPALRALLQSERQRLTLTSERCLSRSEIKAALKGMKRCLYPYQREGVERFLAAGRLLLADDMGLGKTAQAIASCHVLWRSGRVRRGLVIAPAALKPQWAREWAQFTDVPISIIEGTPSEREAIYRSTREGLFIINYEQLLRDLEVIRRWEPHLVVLDEAQRIKNWATKTALSVKGLAPAYRLVLTGTPMENRVDELASVVEWVDDMALEPKWRLNAAHAIRADGKREIIGVRNLDTLRTRLKPCMVRRIRQDVLDQLPPRTDTRVPVELTEPQREEHDALIQPILQLMKKAQTRPLTQAEFLRLMSMLTTQRIISNGLAQLHFDEIWPSVNRKRPEEGILAGLSAPKLSELRQLVRQIMIEQNRKIVVFSQWRRMLTLAHWAVSDMLDSERIRAGFFTGAEGQKRRTQNIVEFHDDPQMRLLFASDAGGVGLNLQRAANCVINMELPWNPAVLEQRIGRVYRLGQDKPIDVFNLVCEQGIESRIASLVGSKQAFFKGLFDGESDTVQFEQSSSFLSRVEKLYDVPKTVDESSLESNGQTIDDEFIYEEDDSVVEGEGVDPFETLIEAGDEAQDAARPVVAAESVSPAPTSESPLTSSGSASSDLGDVRQLFSRLTIRKETGGKVVIEAPEDVASTLSALFEGMAALLQGVSRPPG